MKEQQKPFRNYIILIILVIVTVAIVLALVSYYERRKEYEESLNTRMGFLSQLNENEISNYITDNHEAILYLSDSSDDTYASYEETLKKLLIANDMTKEVIYIDTKKVDSNFLTEFQKDYFNPSLSSISQIVLPNVFVIEEGKVTDILYQGSASEPTDVIYFIEKYMEES